MWFFQDKFSSRIMPKNVNCATLSMSLLFIEKLLNIKYVQPIQFVALWAVSSIWVCCVDTVFVERFYFAPWTHYLSEHDQIVSSVFCHAVYPLHN